MAILSVLRNSPTARAAATTRPRASVRVFQVITSGLVEDAITISAAIGIPRIFDRYIGSDGQVDPLGALCTKVEPRLRR